MKKLFAPRNNKESKGKEKVAGWMAGFILRLQNRFAVFMAARAAGLSNKAQRVWLVIFCVVFGGLSIYAFIGAFSNTDKNVSKLKPAQLSAPKYIDQSDGEKAPVISNRDVEKISRFRKYMDSLKASDKGRQIFDSIINARPGLMDSLQQIESFYYSQSK